MDWPYWVILVIVGTAIYVYARYWYNRPAGLPAALEISYAYATLRHMDYRARKQGRDPGQEPTSEYEIKRYMRDRQLTRRERNDVIRRMLERDWVYRYPQNETLFVIAEPGRWELESATDLRRAAEDTAQSLNESGMSGDKEKAAAAGALAAALRVYERTAPPESRPRARHSAEDIEEAAKERNPESIDRAVTRVRDILQIVTYALPFVREIVRALGL